MNHNKILRFYLAVLFWISLRSYRFSEIDIIALSQIASIIKNKTKTNCKTLVCEIFMRNLFNFTILNWAAEFSIWNIYDKNSNNIRMNSRAPFYDTLIFIASTPKMYNFVFYLQTEFFDPTDSYGFNGSMDLN